MARLDVERPALQTDVTLHTPRNWTAVAFLGALAGLHLFLAGSAFAHHRWEGYLSLIFAGLFGFAALVCGSIRQELAVLSPQRRLRVRTGTRHWFIERSIAFNKIHGVRLTLLDPRRPETARIELICDGELLECPPSRVPREEALYLAVTMGAHLTKIYGQGYGPLNERRDALSSGSES